MNRSFSPVADVHTFNALIIAAAEVKDKYSDKWELIVVSWIGLFKSYTHWGSHHMCVCVLCMYNMHICVCVCAGPAEADGSTEGEAQLADI